MIFAPPDEVAALTASNPFGRLPDGRPDVPDALLARLRDATNDEAWHILSRTHGYRYQFAGGWPVHLNAERTLVGRAVTATFVPLRPDLHGAVDARGAADGRVGRHNAWVIETLREGDVLVVDLFGKLREGTLIGDNLATAVFRRTGTGIVIEGGIRDLARVRQLEEFVVFARGVDPSAIAEVTLAAVNRPVRIGDAVVLPGDAVLGTASGVTFVPPSLVREVVEYSEDVRERDVWGKQRLQDGTYGSGQIDVPVWSADIEAAYVQWRESQRRVLPVNGAAR